MYLWLLFIYGKYIHNSTTFLNHCSLQMPYSLPVLYNVRWPVLWSIFYMFLWNFSVRKMYIVIMGQGQQDSPEASQTPGKNPFDSELLHLVGTGGPDQSSCNEITASQLDYGWFWRRLWFLAKKVFKKAHIIFKDQSDWLALIFGCHEKSLKWCVRLFSRFSILFWRSN